MECEPEELQFLGPVGIYRESVAILRAHRPLYARIAAAFVLPLSVLFLAHIAISHALFSTIDSDDSALESSAPGTASQQRIIQRLGADWAALVLFKAAYLLALLLFSLLSTAAAVFSVASVYSAKHDALTFPRVLSVVPRVWRRLAATFVAAFGLLFAYHVVFIAVFIGLLVATDNGSGLAGLLAFLVAIAYLVGLVYLSVVWHLASVVSVLEDLKGFQAMRKSKALIQGKLPTAVAIFATLNVVFVVVELVFRSWVVQGARHGVGAGGRFLIGLAMLVGAGALLAVVAVVYGAALPGVITSTIEDGVATCKVEDIQKEAFLDNYGDCKDCTPYYYNLNMYNVTNAMDFLEKGDKLKVTEVGPYAYRRHQIKLDVKLADDKNSISYKMYTWHEFVKEKSCATCLDTDQVVSWDISYLNVIAQAGGELGFLRRLAAGTIWGKGLNASAREPIVQANKEKMMRWANGLNSNQPEAWKLLGSTVIGFLSSSVSAIPDVGNMTGLTYSGVFAKRPISDWALGSPSMLAGIGLGTNWHGVCKNGTAMDYDNKCAKCTAATCPDIWSECKRCVQGKRVIALNPITCGRIVSKYAAVYGQEEAIKAVNGTCALCAGLGVCAAPLPGAAEGSGLDYSKTAPSAAALNTYTQLTGCDDKSKIGEYTMYDGLKTNALWANIGERRNPTLAELNAFAVYGNCDAKTANMTCSDVIGADGTSTPPGGASITGFPDKVELESSVMYLNQAKQNISLVNTGEVYDLDGAKLTRFLPPDDLLVYTAEKAAKGTGVPVDGVQPMSFNVGFLAYVSFPMFLTGDKSLYDGVEVTMHDGKIASKETLYDSAGKLKQEYYDRYQTTVDVEPGTGKTMRAYKRLQASYALAKSQYTPDAPMSDVLWPNLTAEVISPAYFGEEVAVITSTRLSTYKTIKGVLSSLLPVLIVGIIVGVALGGFGFLKRRKAVAAKNTYGAAV